jgi:hypothetical protein
LTILAQVMPTSASFFMWLETTGVARLIAESLVVTASLSAVHLIGFTLVTGGALVANLRLLGVLLHQRPIVEVTEAATRGIALGLAISIVTGLLLFSSRAASAIADGTFQVKMLLLVAAAFFHFTLHRNVTRSASVAVPVLRATGAFGLTLWLGVALAGCAFILFE